MNILVIFSDQQHKYSLGKVNPEFVTPNLDLLCDEGVLFENGYSNNPVCGPYRGCLMTGSYTTHCGVEHNGDPLSEDMPTMAQVLREKGYATGFTGKWHLGGNGAGPIPEHIRGGFEFFVGYQCYNGFDPRPPFNNEVIFFDELDRPLHFQEHRTNVTTQLAIEQLRTLHSTGKPFFQLVGYQAPHYPEQPDEEFAAIYDDKVFSKTPDYVEVDPYTPTFSPYSKRPFENCPDYQRYGGNMNEYMRLYAGMVSQIDHGVGEIVEELKRLGVYEDTLIMYTSDHGDMQGSHGLKNKCLPFEKSCGVPFLARYPDGVKGARILEPVSAVDIFATALDVAGCAPVKNDGSSLLPCLKGEAPPAREYVVAEYATTSQSGYRWRMIRDKRYKLVVDYEYQPIYLFDMQADPYELSDLKNDAVYEEVIRDMTQLLYKEIHS